MLVIRIGKANRIAEQPVEIFDECLRKGAGHARDGPRSAFARVGEPPVGL